MDFHCTVMGRKFYESDVPRIAKALAKLAGLSAVEYELVSEEYISEYGADGWRFVAQLQSGYCLMERTKK